MTEACAGSARMVRAVFHLALGAFAIHAAPVCARSVALDCESQQSSPVYTVPAGGELRLVVPDGAADRPTLIVEEFGVDLVWRTDPNGEFKPIVGRPPRLAAAAVAVGASEGGDFIAVRTEHPRAVAAPVRVRVHCAAGLKEAAAFDCLERAAQVEHTGTLGTPEPGEPAICHAFAMHGLATWASRQGKPALSSSLYRAVATLWRVLDDPGREAAALLGRAEQLYDLGLFAEANTLAGRSAELAGQAGIDFLSLRARLQFCMGVRMMDRLDDAIACSAPLPAAFADIGEASEAANVSFTMASIHLTQGRPIEARQLLEQAFVMGGDRISPVVMMRLIQLRSRLAMDEYRLVDALEAVHDALRIGDTAGWPRGAANLLLQAAELHLAVGAADEAEIYMTHALEQFLDMEAGARVAEALLVGARIADARGLPTLSGTRAREAAALFRELGQQDKALLASALASGDDLQAMEGLVGLARQAPGFSYAAESTALVALAQASLRLGDLERAASALLVLEGIRPGVMQRLELDRLHARLALARGDGELARRLVADLIDRHQGLVSAARSGSLRLMTSKRLISVRSELVDAYLASAAQRDRRGEWLLDALLASEPGLALAREAQASDASDADRLIARALVSPEQGAQHRDLVVDGLRAIGARVPPRSLPAAYLGGSPAPLARPMPTLVVVLGETSGVAVMIRDRQRVEVRTQGLGQVRALAGDLLALTSDPVHDIALVEAAAARLSRAMLPEGLGPIPSELRFVLDPRLAAIPVSMLTWPGTGVKLVERSDVRISILSNRGGESFPQVQDIDVFVASAGATDALPALPASLSEPALISAALPGSSLREFAGGAAHADSLTQALVRPGSWVHVAAHGLARPGLTGFAGVWLGGEGNGAERPFLSWLDLVDRRLGAQLVVLNACRLGLNGSSSAESTTGFAAALAMAGAGNVVAALWPVSDSATAVWVPAFYSSLAEAPVNAQPDVAGSLRRAQLTMRGGRRFRHPFFWASLVHYERISADDLRGAWLTAEPAAGSLGAAASP